jgi:hypothetical protein
LFEEGIALEITPMSCIYLLQVINLSPLLYLGCAGLGFALTKTEHFLCSVTNWHPRWDVLLEGSQVFAIQLSTRQAIKAPVLG